MFKESKPCRRDQSIFRYYSFCDTNIPWRSKIFYVAKTEPKILLILWLGGNKLWLEVITVVLIVYPIIWYWFWHGNLKTLSDSRSRIEYLCVPVLENCCLWFLTQIFNQSNQHKRWIITLKASVIIGIEVSVLKWWNHECKPFSKRQF
jgi:hypothetical protein